MSITYTYSKAYAYFSHRAVHRQLYCPLKGVVGVQWSKLLTDRDVMSETRQYGLNMSTDNTLGI